GLLKIDYYQSAYRSRLRERDDRLREWLLEPDEDRLRETDDRVRLRLRLIVELLLLLGRDVRTAVLLPDDRLLLDTRDGLPWNTFSSCFKKLLRLFLELLSRLFWAFNRRRSFW